MEVKNTEFLYIPKSADPNYVAPAGDKRQVELKTQPAIQENITKEMLAERVEGMNEFLDPTPTAVKFQLHEDLNVYYVQVIDSTTDEVLKEIPNKKFLDMYASMTELMGLVVDDKL